MSKNKEKKIEVEFGSKNQAFWNRVKRETLAMIENLENQLMVQKELLIISKRKELEEKRRFKKMK